jgi:hypothetical protein
LNAANITSGTLEVARGGTGTTTSTGTGNVVLSDDPTLYGNVMMPGNVSANIVNCLDLFYGNARVKTFSFVFLLTGTLYTSTYRYSADFYENITIVSTNQSWGVDSQWYTLNANANLIAEQVMDALTYYLKNRPLGSSHEIVMITLGNSSSQGGRILAVKTSSSGGIMYGFNNWTQRSFTFTY